MLQTVKVLGFIYVGIMGVGWVGPVIHSIFRGSPPPFARHVYSGITIGSLFLGMSLLSFKELETSLRQYLDVIFQNGLIGGRLGIVLVSVYLSLTFVIGNITRSYYNLHTIEKEKEEESDSDSSPLRKVIASFRGWIKVTEAIVRFAMIVIIIWLTNTILKIYRETPNSGSLLNVQAFRMQFDFFWHLVQAYYGSLLLWDLAIWLGNRKNSEPELKTKINSILKRQAVPVHCAGIIVSLLMCLPRHNAYLSQFVDILDIFAMLAALAGCVFLGIPVFIKLGAWLGSIQKRDVKAA